MTNRKSLRKQGFTLIELLTVIAIIGILATLIIPTVGAVQKEARKTTARNNARQIATAYKTYALQGSKVRNIRGGSGWDAKNSPYTASNIHDWAAALALTGGLNEGAIWYIGDDDAAPQAFPKSVLNSSDNINSDFRAEDGIAWTVVGTMPRSAPESTTPLLWSRGLRTDGTWKEIGTDPSSSSPWGEDGGHIAYLDAHVDWRRNTFEEDPQGDLVSLRSGSRGESTKSIADAIGASGTTAPTKSNVGAWNW